MEFLGHVMRKEELESLRNTGKIDGTTSRDKQRETYVTNTCDCTKVSAQELLKATEDRRMGRSIIVIVLAGRET